MTFSDEKPITTYIVEVFCVLSLSFFLRAINYARIVFHM